ncbi:MAG: HPr family phosphocarrier protein [Alkalispirochaeta sp.]
MLEEDLTVTNPKGIHARPSAMIVQTAQTLDSTITFTMHGETVAADNIMDVLSLGAAYGETIRVTIDGGDEHAALARMREIFSLNFNDE